MVDGVKDPQMLAKLEQAVKNSIGFDATRNDQVSVVDFPITHTELLQGMANQPAGAMPDFYTDYRRTSAGASGWLPVVLGVPLVMIMVFISLFYMKQRNVQREKQRLVLSSGPGATVSDISDLLADKEGKITPPPATRVNTTDQLENLAKEKPTKVAELLKSTWLADR
jgi:flagellar biosynthesis/type III secretory pathway M-ring protein FliF/YscJ